MDSFAAMRVSFVNYPAKVRKSKRKAKFICVFSVEKTFDEVFRLCLSTCGAQERYEKGENFLNEDTFLWAEISADVAHRHVTTSLLCREQAIAYSRQSN